MPVEIPPKATPAQLREASEYWAALGHFIDLFARAESMLQVLLWRKAGVTHQVAQAVFSGVRIDAAKDFINRIHAANDEERDPQLIETFEQLGVISKARNDIVHFGTVTSGTDRFMTNALLAHVPAKVRTVVVSASILDDMTADLVRIVLHLAKVASSDEDRAKIEAAFPETRGPWRYRPLPRALPESMNPRTPQV